MTQNIVIAAAARTAIGNFGGGLGNLSAPQLGQVAVRGALARANVAPADVDDVIMGQVLAALEGQNPARQTAILSEIPHEATALTVNQVCGSGLRAVMLGAQQIATGFSKIVVAGGQENMTASAHAIRLRAGVKMGDAALQDTMLIDGLTDAFNRKHMGITAENIAAQFNITRDQQDAFAALSQQKAEHAQNNHYFSEEILGIKVKVGKEEVSFDKDEFPRHGTTAEKLAKLRPAFLPEGTVTAGNASGLNDGAAAVVLMTEDEANKRSITPLARIVSYATAGVDPNVMGLGPVPASLLALSRAQWSVKDLDVIEANEAFAAQAIAVNTQLGWDIDKVNLGGGAIALGHPIGASGARVLVTLLHHLKRTGGKKGLATLCIGGGMGVAMCVEAF